MKQSNEELTIKLLDKTNGSSEAYKNSLTDLAQKIALKYVPGTTAIGHNNFSWLVTGILLALENKQFLDESLDN